MQVDDAQRRSVIHSDLINWNVYHCPSDVVEPTIPFSLGILITNDGYGAARDLKITSGQPEIIDNEKGLLITFKIIGAQVTQSTLF